MAQKKVAKKEAPKKSLKSRLARLAVAALVGVGLGVGGNLGVNFYKDGIAKEVPSCYMGTSGMDAVVLKEVTENKTYKGFVVMFIMAAPFEAPIREVNKDLRVKGYSRIDCQTGAPLAE